MLIIVTAIVILSTSIEEVTTKDHSVYASPSNTSTLPVFNFAATGDWGCTSHTTNTVNNIVDKNSELILGLCDYEYYGDNAYCWLEIVEPIDDKMKIAIGNHEVEGNQNYHNIWNILVFQTNTIPLTIRTFTLL